jgi:protein-disulfide isomerase
LASKKEQREEARKQREEREAEERKKQRRKRRIWQVGSILVVAVAIVAILVLISTSGGGSKKVDKQAAAQTANMFSGIAQNGQTLGNPQAKVTIYEFADLQCPFCKAYTVGPNAPFPQIVDKYVKSGKVKIVWRNLTFIGPDSVTAARAAAAASTQGKLWNFVDLFYTAQGTENSGYVTDKFIKDIATKAGIDTAKLQADQNAPLVEQQLGTAQTQANQYGVNSTPSFLIQVGNGKPQKVNIADTSKFEQFTGPIDQALAKAGS